MNCRIQIGYFEIYNEKVYDLLSKDNESLDIRERKNGSI